MLHENTRTYFFPTDDPDVHDELTVELVREISVSKSGGHRLTCKGDILVYVRTGWLAIEIDSERGWEQ